MVTKTDTTAGKAFEPKTTKAWRAHKLAYDNRTRRLVMMAIEAAITFERKSGVEKGKLIEDYRVYDQSFFTATGSDFVVEVKWKYLLESIVEPLLTIADTFISVEEEAASEAAGKVVVHSLSAEPYERTREEAKARLVKAVLDLIISFREEWSITDGTVNYTISSLSGPIVVARGTNFSVTSHPGSVLQKFREPLIALAQEYLRGRSIKKYEDGSDAASVQSNAA